MPVLKTVGQLKDSVAGLLQSENLDNVTDLNGSLSRAARLVAQYADCPEASGRAQYMVYDNVFDYPAPETIFGGAVVDFRPQGVSRNRNETVIKRPVELFDRNKEFSFPEGVELTFEYNLGVPIMRVSKSRANNSVTIDPMNESADWTAGGSVSNFADDGTVYYESTGAMRFTLVGTSSGYIERTLDNSLDLSDYEDVGVAFLAIRTPSTDITSIELRLGSSNANYNNVSVTEGFLGAFQVNDYILVAFDFSAASQTGTPDWSAIDYIRATVTHGTTITNFRVGALFISLPSPYELLYQSAAIFSVAGVLSNTIVDDTDVVILNDAAYTLYEHQCAETIALQSGGSFSEGVVATVSTLLHGNATRPGLYGLYKADNPSEEIRTVGSWYE